MIENGGPPGEGGEEFIAKTIEPAEENNSEAAPQESEQAERTPDSTIETAKALGNEIRRINEAAGAELQHLRYNKGQIEHLATALSQLRRGLHELPQGNEQAVFLRRILGQYGQDGLPIFRYEGLEGFKRELVHVHDEGETAFKPARSESTVAESEADEDAVAAEAPAQEPDSAKVAKAWHKMSAFADALRNVDLSPPDLARVISQVNQTWLEVGFAFKRGDSRMVAEYVELTARMVRTIQSELDTYEAKLSGVIKQSAESMTQDSRSFGEDSKAELPTSEKEDSGESTGENR